MADQEKNGPERLTDPDRLEVLEATGLLDTEAEESFDRLTRLACRLLDAPVGFLALVTPERQFFKSHVGLPKRIANQRETSLALSLCQYTVRSGMTGSFRDLSESTLPEAGKVEEVFGLRSYLGCPVTTSDGHVVGSFSVMDKGVRDWTKEERETLEDLAASVSTEVALRLEVAEHKRDRKRIEQERSRLTRMFDALGEGITILDEEGVLVYANDAAERILGLAKSEMEGRAYQDPEWDVRFPNGEPMDPEELPAARAVEEGKAVRGELMVVGRPDAEPVTLSVNAVPIKDESGELDLAVISFRDVSRRVALEQDLRRQTTRYETLLSEISDVISLIDDENLIQYKSPSIEQVFGFRPEDLEGQPISAFVHPEDEKDVADLIEQARDQPGTPVSVQYRARTNGGGFREVESTGVVPKEADFGLVVVTRDITEQLRAQQLYRTMFETNPSSVSLSRLDDGTFMEVNRAFEKLFGYDRDEVIGRSPLALDIWVNPEVREDLVARLSDRETIQNEEVQLRTGDGTVIDALLSGSALELGGEQFWISVTQDITERKAFEEELEHRSLHDLLTGLANRALFWDRLQHALVRIGRTEGQIAVLFADLDGFKRINDEYGHGTGDEALRRVAGRMQSVIRDSDTVARLGGDEFGLLLEDLSKEADATEAAERLIDQFEPPLRIAGEEAPLHLSCGIAFGGGGEEAGTADELVRRADRAMYAAKQEPGSAFRVYTPDLGGEQPDRLRRELELRDALEMGQIVPYYQPIVDLQDGRIVGGEALARWRHPEKGVVSPDVFIALAEETGQILDLGRVVAQTAVQDVTDWANRGLLPEGFRLHLNVSARELSSSDFMNVLKDLLRGTALKPETVAFEVTETVAMESAHVLREIRGLGFQVAVDDFGTEYATLQRLAEIEVDSLKLDQLFVGRLGQSSRHEAVLDASLTLAEAMNLCPVAEGVETNEQREALLERGCQFGQGFLFSEPVSGDDFAACLQKERLRYQ